MSCNYAEGLSPYHDKGQLGLEEKFDSKSVVSAKVSLLTKWMNEAKHVVIHTGAGISTSAGIPDFRGPQGVWTLEAKGEKPDSNKDFNDAIPTITHMAIMKLVEKGKVKFVVSQNIDGLHLRSNLQRKFLSELHGNMFTEQCSSCNRQFVRSAPAPSVGQKTLNKPCPTLKANGRPCRGRLHDTILDWEHNLPENDLGMADYHSCLADLSICLGTTMQIVPSGNLPLYTKKHGGKLVIVNLQPTKHDRKADLLIHAYVDEVMTMLMKNLNIKIPKYSARNDPSRILLNSSEKFIEWTISDSALRKMKKIYEEKCGSKEAKKRLEMIEDDIPLSITRTYKRKGKEEDDSDLEVVDVIVKPKRTRESSRRGSKRSAPPVFNTTITIKKVTPPPKKSRHEGAEKITIKKNVTPTKTKYEIVTKPKKLPKCEIVYSTDNDLCNDLDMICESDDDEMTNNFTYNFKRYLYDDVKSEETKNNEISKDVDKKVEVKEEVKNEENIKEETSVKKESDEEKAVEVKEESHEDKKEKDTVEEIQTVDKTTELEKNQEEEQKTEEENVQSSEDTENILKPSTSNQNCEEKNVENSSNEENAENSSKEEVPLLENSDQNTEKEPETEEEKTEEKTEEKMESLQLSSNETPSTNPTEDSNNQEMNLLEEEQEKSHFNSDQTETEKTMHEKELAELIATADPVADKSKEMINSNSEEKSKSNEKTENLLQNIESELSSLTNSNLESQIDQMVGQTETSQFDNSLGMSNPAINENYEFYSGEFSSTNNPTDLDYVDNNYYNNF